MNGTSSTGIDHVVVEPGHASSTLEDNCDTEGDWLCAWCQNCVANERERFCVNGRDEFTFTNPESIHFNIITFSGTRGCRQTGTPTMEHTWFPGHAWSFCLCADCGQHLGWFFAGEFQFAGLIKDRIVRALYRRN